MLWVCRRKAFRERNSPPGDTPTVRDKTVRSNNKMMRDTNKTMGCSNACSSIGRRILAHMFEYVLKLQKKTSPV